MRRGICIDTNRRAGYTLAMRKHAGNRLRKREILAIVCLVLLGIALRLGGLRGEQTNLLYNEGAYLTAMQMMASGKVSLYKDIAFAHPPLIIWLGATLWNPLKGNIFALRSIYALGCMLGFAPMFAIVRRLRGSLFAIGTLAFLCLLPAFANELGGNISLEMPQNLVLFAAFWLMLICRRKPAATMFAGGLLFASAFLISETAVLLAATAILALFLADKFQPAPLVTAAEQGEPSDLSQPPAFFAREFETPPPQSYHIDKQAFLWFSLGFGLGMAGILLVLARIPNLFADFPSFYGFGRSTSITTELAHRGNELLAGFIAAPMLMTFGVLGAFKMLRQKRSAFELHLAWFSLLSAILLFVLPIQFTWQSWTPCLTIWCFSIIVWSDWIGDAEANILWKAHIGPLLIIGMVLFSVVGLVRFRTSERPMPATHAFALKVLEKCPEPLFALDPIWNAASGKLPPIWVHYLDDPHSRRREMLAHHDAVNRIVLSCPTIVLDSESTRWMTPEFAKFLRENFKTVIVEGKPNDADYVAILLRADFKNKPIETR